MTDIGMRIGMEIGIGIGMRTRMDIRMGIKMEIGMITRNRNGNTVELRLPETASLRTYIMELNISVLMSILSLTLKWWPK